MHQEARYDRREDDRDINRQELAHFDQFLDSHRETAEQLRKDPSLVDNQEFIKNHPALQSYLQEHPELREQIKSNPNAFMQQEARYDRREDGMNRDATGHRQAASFGEFLGGHSEISQRLSDDPSLVKNQEYLENHPELQQYLSAHPDVKQELMANPQSFVKSAQQFSTTSNTTTAPAVKTPMPDPAKPKQ
jgi:phage-related protein